MSDAREIVICIDMGMTGSVARWRDFSSPSGLWKFASKEKIPTRIAYDAQNKEASIAWGTECNGMPPDQIKECFKAFMGATDFSKGSNTVPGDPGSQIELHRWVRDYLTAFCADVVDFISNEKEGTFDGWRDARVIWIFTVPGSWAAFPVVAEFELLAQDAVSSLFPSAKDSRLFTNVTEGEASALCLLVAGALKDNQYSVGNTVISCDIGGATTDVAISTVSIAGRLTTWDQLPTESVGTVTVEKAFWLYVRDILRSAGAQNPDQLALEMTRGRHFLHERAVFQKPRSGEDCIKIRIPDSCQVQTWSPSEASSVGMPTIENRNLYIHREVFETFFTKLVQHIQAAVDEAINTAAKRGKRPSIIGFCGGGCRIPYVIERLERRYGNAISTTCLVDGPEMATVIGSSLIWEQKMVQDFVYQTSFGIETSDGGIRWGSPEEKLVPSEFNGAYPYVVPFDCHKRGKSNTHRIIAIAKTPTPPRAVEMSKGWTVQVDLQKEKRGALSLSKKYQIVCNISGPWNIEFTAQSLMVTGQDILCKVLGSSKGP